MYRSSTKEGVHRPIYAGFVDMDVEKDKSISLRTLVRSLCPIHYSVAVENISSLQKKRNLSCFLVELFVMHTPEDQQS
jgi:hypothetical protein